MTDEVGDQSSRTLGPIACSHRDLLRSVALYVNSS